MNAATETGGAWSLPEAPLQLNTVESGMLLAMLVRWFEQYTPADAGNTTASTIRAEHADLAFTTLSKLWAKLRAHAEGLGVVWRYGSPDDFLGKGAEP